MLIVNRNILALLILLVLFSLMGLGCAKKQFYVNTFVGGRISENNGRYFVTDNVKKEQIKIRLRINGGPNGKYCPILYLVQNQKGIAAVSVENYGTSDLINGDHSSNEFYLVFINGRKTKYIPIKGHHPIHSLRWMNEHTVSGIVDDRRVEFRY